MAVIIDMDMPKSCEDCRFHQYHSGRDYVCIATPMFYPFNLANYKDGRKDFCPLKSTDEMIDEIKALGTWSRSLGSVTIPYHRVEETIHKYCDKEDK